MANEQGCEPAPAPEPKVRTMPKMRKGELLRQVKCMAPELSPALAQLAAMRLAQDYEAGYSLDGIAFNTGLAPEQVKAIVPMASNPVTVGQALQQRMLTQDDHAALAAWADDSPARLLLSAATAARMMARQDSLAIDVDQDDPSQGLTRARRAAELGMNYRPSGLRSQLAPMAGADASGLGLTAQECHLICHSVMASLDLRVDERLHLKQWRWHVLADEKEPDALKAMRWRFLHALQAALNQPDAAPARAAG